MRRECGIPIAAGENAATLHQFGDLLRAGAVDILQPSPAKSGGISTLRQVFALAAFHNARVVPHTFYDGPGLLAALHCSAVFQREPLVEWRYFDLEAPLYGERCRPVNGNITVPDGPGLGADPDPGVLKDYSGT
jgi:L-alanine-DL-glutamate epimerase-like enolase superfamily enzyme